MEHQLNGWQRAWCAFTIILACPTRALRKRRYAALGNFCSLLDGSLLELVEVVLDCEGTFDKAWERVLASLPEPPRPTRQAPIRSAPFLLCGFLLTLLVQLLQFVHTIDAIFNFGEFDFFWSHEERAFEPPGGSDLLCHLCCVLLVGFKAFCDITEVF